MINAIDARNISKSIGGNLILKNVSLEVTTGEFIIIFGASGSGKTTLLYLLGGLERPSSGKVFLLGQEVDKLNNQQLSNIRKNEIAFVFQFFNLIPELSVIDNVKIVTYKATSSFDIEYFNYLMDFFDLKDRANSFVTELSGGEQQRVAIVRALINRPKIIFADEPTGNLDSKNRCEVMELFKKINQELKTTIVMTTHDNDARIYASKVINIVDGQIK